MLGFSMQEERLSGKWHMIHEYGCEIQWKSSMKKEISYICVLYVVDFSWLFVLTRLLATFFFAIFRVCLICRWKICVWITLHPPGQIKHDLTPKGSLFQGNPLVSIKIQVGEILFHLAGSIVRTCPNILCLARRIWGFPKMVVPNNHWFSY